MASTCELECANGGYCTKRAGEPSILEKEAARGTLIEECVCVPGWTGIACSIEVEACSLQPDESRTCHNGVPCTQLPSSSSSSEEYTCDCSIADAFNAFAGNMCRRPATEYCTNDKLNAQSFCTSGGKCEKDFTGTGDKGDSLPFQHAGCRCPPEFVGPHCEFLKGTSFDLTMATTTTTAAPPTTGFSKALPILAAAAVLLLAAFAYRAIGKRKKGNNQHRWNSRPVRHFLDDGAAAELEII